MDLGKLKPHINSKKIPKKPTQKLKLSTFIFNLLEIKMSTYVVCDL